MAVDDQRCYLLNDAAQLVVVQLRDGRVLARIPDVRPGFPPLLAPNGLLVNQADRLMFASHDRWIESLAPWSSNDAMAVTSPAIAHCRVVYVGIEGEGLVCFGGEAP
jgi:hypothetical protein